MFTAGVRIATDTVLVSNKDMPQSGRSRALNSLTSVAGQLRLTLLCLRMALFKSHQPIILYLLTLSPHLVHILKLITLLVNSSSLWISKLVTHTKNINLVTFSIMSIEIFLTDSRTFSRRCIKEYFFTKVRILGVNDLYTLYCIVEICETF